MDDLIDTLVLPTERPPVSLDIKRALLTFDRVNLCAPDDREIINPVNFMTALLPIPVPFAFSSGDPVLPLGKFPGYDDAFVDLLKELDPAVQQGNVVVRKAPELIAGGMVLGSPPNPEGWASAKWVISVFRGLVSQGEVLRAACQGLPTEETLRRIDLDSLAPGGLALTQGGFGAPPTLADLNDGSLHPDLVPVVQRLAATRLGSMIKCIGLCENTGLHPWSNDSGMVSLLDHFQRISASSIGAALNGRSEQVLVQRALRAERVVFAHELPDEILSRLSVEEVLRLRTTAWGRAGRARTAFFGAVRRLADECPDDQDFDRAVREAIQSYSIARSDLADEWKKLGLKLGCPALTGAVTGAVTGNVFQNLLGMPGWSVALGVTAVGSALTGVIDEVVSMLRKRRDVAMHPGKALVMPYSFALRD